MAVLNIALVMVCVMKMIDVCVQMAGQVFDVKLLAVPMVALATARATSLLDIVFVAMVT